MKVIEINFTITISSVENIIDAENNDGNTPLLLAIKRGKDISANQLLKKKKGILLILSSQTDCALDLTHACHLLVLRIGCSYLLA